MTSVDCLSGPCDSDESYSLVIARQGQGHILLGRKTRGFGQGKWVLPGGKDRYWIGPGYVGRQPGTVDAARELNQETGLVVEHQDLALVGTIHASDQAADTKEVQIYATPPLDSESLSPSSEFAQLDWWPDLALPYGEMPADYRLWLPHILGGYFVQVFLEFYGDKIVHSQTLGFHHTPGSRLQELAPPMIQP